MWSKNLPNFPFFEKEMRRRKTEFDPFDYYYQSETILQSYYYQTEIKLFYKAYVS